MTITIHDLKKHKNSQEPLVCLTAYTYPMARLMAPIVDLILVGDSLGNVIYGYEDTTRVTFDQMITHGDAVVRGAGNQCITVVDMSYGTYEESDEQALENAKRIIAETGCDAVKLEGGVSMASRIKVIVDHGIPVMGHIGLLPQSAPAEGGYKIKGKTQEQIDLLKKDATAIEQAGAFAIVIEGTIENAATEITHLISIPTIGIGASVHCDGQILVTDDLLGVSGERVPKFVKKYAELYLNIKEAISTYKKEVKSRSFPTDEYTY